MSERSLGMHLLSPPPVRAASPAANLPSFAEVNKGQHGTHCWLGPLPVSPIDVTVAWVSPAGSRAPGAAHSTASLIPARHPVIPGFF